MHLVIRTAALRLLMLPAIVFAQPFEPLPAVDLAKLKPSDFTDEGYAVRVQHPGPIGDRIPLLLLPDDELTIGAGDYDGAMLRRGRWTFRVMPSMPMKMRVGEGEERVGPFRVVPLHVEGRGQIAYVVRFVHVP